MIFTLNLLLLVLSLPLLAAAGYLFLATLLSARSPLPAEAQPRRRFRFIVPAHNESAGIASTVVSLLGVDYPSELFEVVVVADNCEDDTAERARQAGAIVLERHDKERRGKGYALLLAFSNLPAEVDSVAVVDADTLVSPNILRAFAARRDLGAVAIQADYAVRNPNAAWRTRLIAIAFGAFHIVRSRARERLSLSCGLRGNGMCFSAAIFSEVPHEAFSIVEDVEYGLRLGEAGYRVHYADEAHVYGEMVSTAAAASSQRRRWEEGRKELVRRNGRRLLLAGLAKRNRVLFDLALDLLLPPLSRIAVASFLGVLAASVFSFFTGSVAMSLPIFACCLLAVVAYVLRGWSVSGTGLRGLVDSGLAPVYVVWKASLRFRKASRPISSGCAPSASDNLTRIARLARRTTASAKTVFHRYPPRRTLDSQYHEGKVTKKILVTGGAGFIGSHLCERLIKAGEDVLCVDNYFTGSKKNVEHLLAHPLFEIMRHDVTFSLYVEVERIFNLACPASPVHYQFDPVQTTKTSVHGAINMLGLAKRVKARILQASTSEVYGDPEVHPQPESYWGKVNPIGIRSCYDEGKRCAETLFFDYHRQHGVDIKVIRIFNTYGPRMNPNDGRVVSNFIVQALRGEDITIYGDGQQTRSFCYVDDLVEGMLRMMDSDKGFHGPVNIGNPGEFTMLQLAEKVVALVGGKSKLVHKPLPQDDPKQRKPIIELAKDKLGGWQPKVNLDDGLKETVAYFRKVVAT